VAPDETLTGAGDEAALCPWCAAAIAEPGAARCPSCGAMLPGDELAGIPGVTELDPTAMHRTAPVSSPPSLGSILMGGADTPRPSPAEMPALAAPDDAVRLEMMRLQLAAERAELEQEAASLESEEAVLRAEAAAKAGSPAAGSQDPASAPEPGHLPDAG
jgi:hypothetical protein